EDEKRARDNEDHQRDVRVERRDPLPDVDCRHEEEERGRGESRRDAGEARAEEDDEEEQEEPREEAALKERIPDSEAQEDRVERRVLRPDPAARRGGEARAAEEIRARGPDALRVVRDVREDRRREERREEERRDEIEDGERWVRRRVDGGRARRSYRRQRRR